MKAGGEKAEESKAQTPAPENPVSTATPSEPPKEAKPTPAGKFDDPKLTEEALKQS